MSGPALRHRKGAENARVLHEIMTAYIAGYQKLDATQVSMTELYQQAEDLQQRRVDMLEARKGRVTPAFYTYQSIALRYLQLGERVIRPVIYRQGFNKPLSEAIPEDYWDIGASVELDDRLLANPGYERFVRREALKAP